MYEGGVELGMCVERSLRERNSEPALKKGLRSEVEDGKGWMKADRDRFREEWSRAVVRWENEEHSEGNAERTARDLGMCVRGWKF